MSGASDPSDGRSLWQDARGRFLGNRAAMASLVTLLVLVLFVLFGDFLAAWSNEEIDWAMLGNVAEEAVPPFANGHYFGVDELGRDLFARTVQGAGISLMVGVLGALVSMVVGTLYGAVAGYLGGAVDNVMMRIVDVLMAIPYMFVLIVFMVVFGRSILMLFVGIGLISWLDMARIARGRRCPSRTGDFVEAAVAIGVRPGEDHPAPHHPQSSGRGRGLCDASRAFDDHLRKFHQFSRSRRAGTRHEPGRAHQRRREQMQYGTLWQLLFPLFFFVTTLFVFFFVGDGLRDALDPRDR